MLNKKLKLITLIGVLMVAMGCTSSGEKTGSAANIEATNLPKVAVLVTEGFHDAETYMPIGYLTKKGFETVVIGPEIGEVKAYNSDFKIVIEKTVDEVNVDDFAGLIIPGGQAPAALKEHEASINFSRDFYNTGKPVAAVCHGPQVLAAAGVLDGVTATATGSIQEELEEAGATFVDVPVQVDGNTITSRVPGDLVYFTKAIEEALLSNM